MEATVEQKRRLRILRRFAKRRKLQQQQQQPSPSTTQNPLAAEPGPGPRPVITFTDFLNIDYQKEEELLREEDKKTNQGNNNGQKDDDNDEDEDDDNVEMVAPPRMIIDVDVELGLKPRTSHRMLTQQQQRQRSNKPSANVASNDSNNKNNKLSSSPSALSPQDEGYYEGCVPLSSSSSSSHNNQDALHLNELQCWIRQQLQLFSASAKDNTARGAGSGRRSSVAVGRVGIRCVHCARAALGASGGPLSASVAASAAAPPQPDAVASSSSTTSTLFAWPPAAMSFPFNAQGLYAACSQKTHLHFPHCPYLPKEEKARFQFLTTSSSSENAAEPPRPSKRSRGGMTAAMYFAVSARQLGVLDMEDGMRFGRDLTLEPLPFETIWAQLQEEKQQQQQQEAALSDEAVVAETVASATATGSTSVTPQRPATVERLTGDEASEQVLAEAVAEPDHPETLVARSEDKALVTDYIFLLIRQMALCHAVPSDFSSRGKKTKSMRIGFAGFCCRHCNAANASAKDAMVFASSSSSCRSFCSAADNLSSSLSGSFSGHLAKCPFAPAQLKKALLAYKRIHQRQMAQLPYGSQRRLFHEMWTRLRAADKSEAEMEPIIAALRKPPPPPPKPVPTVPMLKTDKEAAGIDSANTTTATPTNSAAVATFPTVVPERSPDYPVSRNEETVALLKRFIESFDPATNDRLILPEDRFLVSDYVFLTMRQLKLAMPTPGDTVRIRRGTAVVPNFPGVCCIHCADQPHTVTPSGRSFPSAPDNFASCLNTSLYNHMQACPYMEADLKQALADLRKLHSAQCSSLKFGSQRRYFNMLFERLKTAQTSQEQDATVELAKAGFLQLPSSSSSNATLFVCKHCNMVPVHFRAPGSCFANERPSNLQAAEHKRQCHGGRLDLSLAVETFRQGAAALGKEPLQLLEHEAFRAMMQAAMGSENEGFLPIYEEIRGILGKMDSSAAAVTQRLDLWRHFSALPDPEQVKTSFATLASDLNCSSSNINDHEAICSFLFMMAPGWNI